MNQRLIIRLVRVEDDIALKELYDSLDADERYRRFFSSHRPTAAFFTDLATVAERDGARFVAIVPGGALAEDRIVGEAGYTLLPTGDGAFAITVAHEWRGQLEALLLDAVSEAAAEAGVRNLETDVLTVDRPLLDLLRSRDSAVIEHDGWRAVRVRIGTGGRQPTWQDAHDRPRVLVESPNGRWHAEDEVRAAGLDMLICRGPDDYREGCPALNGQPCELAAGADLVVVAQPSDDDRWNELVAAHATVHPDVSVRVEPSVGTLTNVFELFDCKETSR